MNIKIYCKKEKKSALDGTRLKPRLFSSTGATRTGKAKIKPLYPLGFKGLNKFFMRYNDIVFQEGCFV